MINYFKFAAITSLSSGYQPVIRKPGYPIPALVVDCVDVQGGTKSSGAIRFHSLHRIHDTHTWKLS